MLAEIGISVLQMKVFLAIERWTATVQPKVGLSYSNTFHPWQGRQVTKFEVGVNLLLCRDRWCGVAGYRHMSNGKGFDPSNAGLDFLEGGVGYQF